MTLLQEQAYHLWFQVLSEKIMEWSKAKPANTDLMNCVKALSEIGIYTNQLKTENVITAKTISILRSDKNRAVERARRSEEELEKLQIEIKESKTKLKLGL